MSGFNGSGTFNISGVGLPYVSGTVISSSVANTLNTQLAAGLSNCITKDGQQVLTANIPFNNYKITGLGVGTAGTDSASVYNIQCSTGTFLTVSGADTIVGTASPAITSGYVTGMTYRFIAAGTNTGAVTLNISSQGAKAITKNGTTALAAGDIPSGVLVSVTYDGTQFVLQNQSTFASLTTATLTVTGNATIGGNASITGTLGVTGKTYQSGGNTLTGGNTLLGYLGTSGLTNNGIAFAKNQVAVSTTLSANVTATDLTINLTDGTGFPTGGGTILVDNEQITYASRSGNVLTVSSISNRGVNGTAVTTHVSGAAVSSATFGTTTLSAGIDNSTSTIPVTDASNFPNAGTVLIDGEQISYTGKTGTSLTGATRAVNGTTANAHLSAAAVIGVQFVGTSSNLKYDDVTGAMKVPNLTVTNLYAPNLITGMKNRIINGGMDFSQRGASFAAIAAGAYSLDRWRIGYNGSMVTTVTQDTVLPNTGPLPNNEFQNCLKVAVTTADTSITGSDSYVIEQSIEGYNIRDLINKTFTVSFWVRSTVTGTYCVSVRNSGYDKSIISTYTINAADTWEYKTITLYGGLITTGTWNWTNGIGLTLGFALACGPTYQAAANTWQSGNYIATSAQVNAMSSTSNVFALTGVQLEKGEVATSYEHRLIGTELALCQRYYEIFSIYGGSYAAGVSTYVAGNGFYRVTKRSTPTISLSSVTYVSCSTIAAQQINANGFGYAVSVSGPAQFQVYGDVAAAIEL